LTFYLDTSLLVAALTKEVETEKVQSWLATVEPGTAAISDWVTTEFSAVLAIKLRNRQIAMEHRASALAMFARLKAESLHELPVAREQFRAAARLADQHVTGLRAGDALHLAICAAHGAVLCTLDRRLSEAGPLVGVETFLP